MFYEEGSVAGIRPSHAPRLRRILTLLDHAREPRDVTIPTYRTHALSGTRAGQWSMSVNANWRVVFRFVDEDVHDVDYLDYH